MKSQRLKSNSKTNDFQQITSDSEQDMIESVLTANANDSTNQFYTTRIVHGGDVDEVTGNNSSTIDTKDVDSNVKLTFLRTLREPIGNFVQSEPVENIILTLIIINAIMMGLQTFDFVSENPQLQGIFELTDFVFLVIFTAELGLHLFHLGLEFRKDGWIVFDFILIIFSWSLSAKSIKSMRAFRILRILPKVDVLKEVIDSIIVVLPRMATVFLLLALILFIFSILFTQLFGNMHEDGQTEVDYFSKMETTLLTLIQLMTLDGWSDVAREVMVTYTWSWIPMMIYVCLTGIVITNIVIAIICDSVLYMNQEEDEKRQEEEKKDMNYRIERLKTEMMSIRQVIKKKSDPKINFEGGIQSQRPVLETASSTSSYDTARLLSINQSNNQEYGKDISSLGNPKNSFRVKCGNFVDHDYVQAFIMTLIVINSIMMAIGTYDFVTDDPPVLRAFDIVDTVFLSIYTVESSLQLIHHGPAIYKDRWATFDLFLVLMSWAFSLTPIPVQAARSLRIVRILRLIPKLESMKLIISAVIRVLPKLGGISGILFLLFYIFAIIFTDMFKDYQLGDGYDGYFSSLDATMFTLFQIMTMSDWASLSRELQTHLRWAPIVVTAFVVVSGFIFLNLIIALICEAMGSVHELASEIEEKKLKKRGLFVRKETNIDRLQYLEESQREISHYLDLHALVLIPPLPQDRDEIFHDAMSGGN